MAEENAKTPGTSPPALRVVDQGKRQLIIAPRRGTQALAAGLRPMSSAALRGLISQMPDVEVTRVLRPRRAVSTLSLSPDEATEVYVVRVDADRAELLKHTTPPQLLVEEDAVLEYGAPASTGRLTPARLASWSAGGAVETRPIQIRVVGEGDRPLVNAGVSLAGEGFPQEGRTDKKGEVTLPLLTVHGQRARALFVAAPSNYWDHYLIEPEVSEREVNVVRLRAIGETLFGFPEQFRYGWGQIQMGLDRLPDTLTGKGVKIAIVDSGVDTSHPLLRQIRLGVDLTSGIDPQSWAQDVIGHGTHCAGVIAARDESGKKSMRGFAPEAEVHVLKALPGGRLSSLLEAIDYCLAAEVDIINLSLGTPLRSQIVEQKLEEAARHGIACIAAAGNSGGPVQYPASSAYTLAVGAVGRLNEYPDRTWEATTVVPDQVAPDGIFAPSFSAAGPEVAVCAPGVAIVSTVPGGYEPLSGTSMAAPHVTGLAALLLAHHPAFQGPLRARGQERVAGLFQVIRSMCVPYPFDGFRAGAGMPRLHGLEWLLRPSVERDRATAGNGHGTAADRPGPPMYAPPMYAPPSMPAQPWPIQALIESLRRQYMSVV